MQIRKIIATFLAAAAPALSQAENIVIPSSSTVQVLPIATEGAACVATPDNNTAIRADYTAILTCQGGIWKRPEPEFWRNPVADYTALSAITTDPIGTMRVTLDTKRAFVWTGTTWQAVSVDQNGNLNVPGTVSAGKVQFNDVVTEGNACSPNGLTARNTNGLLLSCQSGTWQKQTDVARLPNYQLRSVSVVGDGTYIAKASCATGGSPRIILVPGNFYTFVNTSAPSIFNAYAVDVGAGWIAYTRTYAWNGAALGGFSLAEVYCYYPTP